MAPCSALDKGEEEEEEEKEVGTGSMHRLALPLAEQADRLDLANSTR